jgi:hypothetical protein
VSEQRARFRAEHARVGKKIINFDSGGYGICAWSDCYRDACSLYEVRQHEHARSIPCDSSLAKHITFAFCRETCKQYWLAGTGSMARDTEARNRGAVSGMLPPGYKKSIL